MPRSRINSASKDLITDDGAVLASVVEGEQVGINITLNWITNLSGYSLTVKAVEADMSGEVDDNGYPLTVKESGQVIQLPIIDVDFTDNKFEIIIPEDLTDNWTTEPEPNKPSYAWIGLEVRDTGIGSEQKIWKPLRGLIEVLYSPTEEI
jgi:hypothetical protein